MGLLLFLLPKARSFKQGEMTGCVRYTEKLEIKEQFLGSVGCSKQEDANAIYRNVKQFLQDSGIADLPVVAQCYDGPAVMAGHVSGIQQKILQDQPTAIYTHHMAHKSTVALVEACKVNSSRIFLHSSGLVYLLFTAWHAPCLPGGPEDPWSETRIVYFK